MKKILLILFVLIANISFAQYGIDENAIYLDINKNVGIGIKTPTSRLHVFGNGTTSNLLNLVNDKDATKDSSVIVDAIGNMATSSLIARENIYLSGLLSRISFNRGGYISAPGFNCKFTGMGIDVDTAHYYAIHYNRVLSSDNDTTISLGNYHLNVDDYNGFVGIGTYRPTYRLDIFGNGGTTDLLKVSNDINSTYDSTFVIKSSGYVGIGSNTTNYPLQVWGSAKSGANIYSEYSGGSLVSAIKGSASGGAGYGIVGTASTLGTAGAGGLFQNTAGGLALDLRADNGIALRIISGDNVVNSIRFHSITTTLPDNSTYGLPTGYSWIGEIDVDSLGYSLFTAQIRCDADGTPYLEGVSWKRWSSKTYVEVGSTDGYLNITDGGSGMVITNTLGYTIKATLRFRTKQ